MARKLILVRHGRVLPEYDGRLVGATDLPLGPEGRVQAEALARALDGLAPDACFASPLRRARETAEILGARPGWRWQESADLREIDFGLWECRAFADIERADPRRAARWAAWDPAFAFPGGESIAAFAARTARAAAALAAAPGRTVLAVAHGGVIRAVVCALLGLDLRNYVLFDVRTATLTLLDVFDGRATLLGMNIGSEGRWMEWLGST